MMILGTLLASLLFRLRATVAHVATRDRAPALPRDHLDHLFACFQSLYADWRNGTLPNPPPPVPASRDRPDTAPSVAAGAKLPRTAV